MKLDKKSKKKDIKKDLSELEKSKEQSKIDSQGSSDFTGSGYNGPGHVDHDKTIGNRSRR